MVKIYCFGIKKAHNIDVMMLCSLDIDFLWIKSPSNNKKAKFFILQSFARRKKNSKRFF